ncbi:DNA-deoxyinosine glycosylase [Paenibacillus sp. H1-7]|uniref:DNA-deoxyinosine glycosylase n=1 Tax=Paenibacillus sp. H1-7 TaxID=2282849 RepID=UPI0031F302DB
MSLEDGRLQGLPPIADASCRILILGSMPGALSLEKQEYYGHPRNHFWKLLYAIFGSRDAVGGYADPSGLYDERLAFALQNGIALWDVLAECEREGSLDTAIRKPEANDFGTFFRTYPGIGRVYFNGQAASELYRKQVLPQLQKLGLGETIVYQTLPSSSPARAMSLEAKLESWRMLGRTGDGSQEVEQA